jgi:hypothetical protein
MRYEERTHTINEQGIRCFASPADRDAEDHAAAILERRWGLQLHRYEPFDQIDWYGSRNGMTVAFIELKTRSHGSESFPTVFMNYRKYLALFMSWQATGKKCLFVVQFTDGIRAVNVLDIDATQLPLRGCRRIVKSPLDIEPVIEVPVCSMVPISEGGS